GTASAGAYEVKATVTQTGGNGGNGINGANGGAGAASTLLNGAAASTPGTLNLLHTAIGGNGGSSDSGTGGKGAAASSALTLVNTSPTELTLTAASQ
ncbi:hypothetical protein GTP58_30925, partial [Duganella sp. CY15W]|nr:hypothetical protein [Duganella sp. CY15W]